MSQPSIDDLSAFYEARLRRLLETLTKLQRGELAPPPGFTVPEAAFLIERSILSTYRMLASLGREDEALRLIQTARNQ